MFFTCTCFVVNVWFYVCWNSLLEVKIGFYMEKGYYMTKISSDHRILEFIHFITRYIWNKINTSLSEVSGINVAKLYIKYCFKIF